MESTPPPDDPDGRVFCMGPAADDEVVGQRSAFGWALTGALGRPVGVRSMNYDELVGGLADADFAWLPPAVYVRARAKHTLHLLSSTAHPRADLHDRSIVPSATPR